MYPGYDADRGTITVIGEVAMWGGLIEGTQGWRAERAYPTCLSLPFEAGRHRAALAEAYRVPVKLKNWLSEPQEAPGLTDEDEEPPRDEQPVKAADVEIDEAQLIGDMEDTINALLDMADGKGG